MENYIPFRLSCLTNLQSYYRKKLKTPVKNVFCSLCSCTVKRCTTMAQARGGESASTQQCTWLTIMLFHSRVLNSSPELGAMVRIRSRLYGPSVNYLRVNHACRVRFPLCRLQAPITKQCPCQLQHLTHPLYACSRDAPLKYSTECC